MVAKATHMLYSATTLFAIIGGSFFLEAMTRRSRESRPRSTLQIMEKDTLYASSLRFSIAGRATLGG